MENIILMIDKDNEKSRKLKVNLENNGYKVLITPSVDEGLMIINSNNIALILIFDINIDFERLKDNDKAKNISILAVLDNCLKSQKDTLNENLDDYIFEPFDKEQLYLKINNHIKIKRLQDIINKKDLELENAYNELNDFGLIDKITGLYNKYYFEHMLKNQCSSAERYGYQLSGIMLCIDNNIEDIEEFNEVLKRVANTLEENLRSNDILVRLNFQEFYVLLPHTGLKDAMFVAEKLRKIISDNEKNITISAGITGFNKIDKGINKENELIIQAREALKKAISNGGNKVECF